MNRKLAIVATLTAFALATAGIGFAATAPDSEQMQQSWQHQKQQQEPQGSMHGSMQHDVKQHVVDYLDEALPQHPLSTQQKQEIENALQSSMERAKAERFERQSTLNRELELFKARSLDKSELEHLQNKQMDRISQGLVDVVSRLHQVLTPAQRDELVSYVQAHEKTGVRLGAW
jgi:hypothetical protein